MPAICSGEWPGSAFGRIAWLISKFWQKTQRRLQWPKKIVPDPFQPRRQSSSPK